MTDAHSHPSHARRPAPRQRRRADWLAARASIAILCFGLVMPLLGTFLPVGQSMRIAENRRLANLPQIRSFTAADFVAYVDGLRRFARDRFGFRGDLIWLRSLLLVRGLGVSSNPSVVLGEGDWMFYSNDSAIENFVRAQPYSEAELQRTVDILHQRAALIEKNWGARFIFLVVPAKETIYPSQMPRYLRERRDRSKHPTRIEQLSQRLSNDQALLFIDLGPVFLEHAASERLYQKTDTHWNQRGAYLAYDAIIRAAVDRGYLRSGPVPRSSFQLGESTSTGGDLAGMLGLQDEFREIQLELKPRIEPQWLNQQWRFEQDLSERSRVVVFGDSFLPPLAPLLAENFSRVTFIRSRELVPELLASEAPTLVIQQTSERLLSYPMN